MPAQIAESLPLFFAPDDVLEVRILDAGRPGRKVAGYMLARNIPTMAPRIAEAGADAGGVYFTPQRLDPVVLNRCRHALVEVTRDRDAEETRPRLTRDADVLERRYLLIDIDPVRPATHRKDSATDGEKEAAFEVAKSVRDCLCKYGIPAPIVVDSGNGYHLYFRLVNPLPGGEADATTDPFAVLLRTLKGTFDTPAAAIDGTVFNASRIMKVPGTVARKGTPTPERPHRQSKLLEVPSDWHR